MPDISLRILLSAQNTASSVISSVAGSLGALAPAALAASAVLAGVGTAVAYSVKAAAQFQSSMTTLVTGAGELQSNLAMVSQGILNMSVATGTSTQQLTAGMYMIESAGYHGAAGLQVLQTAAEGAKVGNADLGTVSNVLTTILHDYGMSASSAVPAMNALITTVAQGKTHMQDLATAMGNVLPLASSLHISFPQVAGALAQMTNSGMTAQRASMNLANAIRALAAPSATAQAAMSSVGISTTKLNDVLTKQGLQQALLMVSDAVGKKFPAGSSAWTQAMKAIMGGATGLNVALMLGGKNMAGYDANIKAISASMNGSKSSVQGWALVQGTASQKAAQAQAALQVLAITIGTKLLPVVSNILTAVTPLITRFAAWASTIQANSPVLAVLGGVLAGLAVIVMAAVVPALIAAAGGFLAITVAGAPLWIILLAVIAVVTGLILVIQHWGAIAAWLKGAWGNIGAWFQSTLGSIGGFFTNLWNGIKSTAQNAWNSMTGGISNAINGIKTTAGGIGNWFTNLWNGVKSHTASAWSSITSNMHSTVSTSTNWLESTWKTATVNVGNALLWLYNHNYYVKDFVDAIRNFVSASVAWLHSTWTSITTWIANKWMWLKDAAIRYWSMIVVEIQARISQAESWLHSTWTSITTWISSKWQWLSGIAHTVWTTITGAIQTAVTVAWNWLTSIWNTVSSWLASKWNSFTQLAQNAWQAVSGVFASIWTTYIAGPLGNLWTQLTGWFGNLATQAVTWGKNMVQGLINGITGMLGDVGQAAQNVMSTIAGYLGFHSPAKLGEGRHIIEWGQNAVKGFLQGMNSMQPQLNATMQHMINPMISGGQSGSTVNNNSRGPMTFHINVTMNGSGNSSADGNNVARLLGDQLRAQFGNI